MVGEGGEERVQDLYVDAAGTMRDLLVSTVRLSPSRPACLPSAAAAAFWAFNSPFGPCCSAAGLVLGLGLGEHLHTHRATDDGLVGEEEVVRRVHRAEASHTHTHTHTTPLIAAR